MTRLPRAIAVCCLALSTFMPLVPARAAGGAADILAPASPELRGAIESYRLCIAINLPPDLRKVNDAQSAAQVASQKCASRRLQLAGRYALDNVGTRNTRNYVDGVTIQLITDLGLWVEGVNARRESPNPAERRSR